ncbi:MAG TPA: R3H domain-containing nucleic acid-binding protein [Candidatus Paceibacterota bacterium]|jgi:spoIIIJ-associated protein|nr:R3H domain-containing nucleic acid-binding protein [Candidatus Paceibacterota bacterium]
MDIEDIIKQVLTTIFQNAKVNDLQLEVTKNETEKKFVITAEITPASIFIGRGGEILDALENVIGSIIRSHTIDRWFVEIDINNYRTEKNFALKELAKKAAHRVLVLKTPVRMDPMNARDRRLIHSEIALYPDLISESEGTPPNRYVVIKYRE